MFGGRVERTASERVDKIRLEKLIENPNALKSTHSKAGK